jgi:hypothetical protein
MHVLSMALLNPGSLRLSVFSLWQEYDVAEEVSGFEATW